MASEGPKNQLWSAVQKRPSRLAREISERQPIIGSSPTLRPLRSPLRSQRSVVDEMDQLIPVVATSGLAPVEPVEERVHVFELGADEGAAHLRC